LQYTGRLGVYLKTLDDMNADLISFTNAVSAQGLGFDYAVTFTLPIAQAMALTIYVRYFLDNGITTETDNSGTCGLACSLLMWRICVCVCFAISAPVFAAVIFLLVLLGMLLIYSLLLNDVDSRTYEYGMLRALGMKHRTLVQILLTKSFFFSLPGSSLGLFCAFLANIPLALYLADFAIVSPVFTFLPFPLLLSLSLGFTLPLVANLVPISRALGKTLRDSLDVYHVVLSEVSVRMIKLENLGIDLWQSALAVLMIVGQSHNMANTRPPGRHKDCV